MENSSSKWSQFVGARQNQREYCEKHEISLKAFGNWRAKFQTEPELPARQLLYRRRGCGGLSHSLSHTPSHTPSHRPSHSSSHGTYPSSAALLAPAVPPVREGHRRRFSDADRNHILNEAAKPGASVSEVARRFGIARRVLCRWRQELAASTPAFVAVEIINAPTAHGEVVR